MLRAPLAIIVTLALLVPTLAHADKQDPTPGPWIGVAASIDGRLVAKWTIERVELSTDGGATFAPAVSGAIARVAMSSDGVLYVVRGDLLTVREPSGALRESRVVVMRRVTELVAEGDTVVLLGAPAAADESEHDDRFFVSTDRGRTFSARPAWRAGNFQTNIALHPGGTIDYVSGWEAACGGGYQQRFRGAVHQAELAPLKWMMDSPGTATPSLSGFGYAIDSCGEGDERLCVQTDDEVLPLALDRPADLALERGWSLHTRSLGKRTLVLANGTLVMADGTRGKVLGSSLPFASPYDITSFTGSARGEAWVVVAGHVHHFARGAWTRV